jgi:hypothetical protein
MRWLFLLVFSLNLAYVGWEMSRPSENYAEVPALKNVQPVILLSELEQKPSSAQNVSTVLPEDKQVKGQIEISPAEQLSKYSPVDQRADVINAAVSNAVAVEKAPADPVAKPAVTAVAPEQEKQLAAGQAQMNAEEVEQAGTKQATDCYTLGPFRDLDNLRGLTREIKSYVVKADFRGREEKEQTLYWVYLKPEKTRKKAIETGKRLKAKKIKDFYVIRDGEKENGLSLGRFRNKESAYGLAKKVQILGFDVIVEPVFRSYTIYWLDYQLSSGVSIPESIFDKYIKSAKKNKISRLSRDCAAL